MERQKLNQIIEERNEEREDEAKRIAHSIISEIEQQHKTIKKAAAKIEELRKELQKLSVETMDESEVLGGAE